MTPREIQERAKKRRRRKSRFPLQQLLLFLLLLAVAAVMRAYQSHQAELVELPVAEDGAVQRPEEGIPEYGGEPYAILNGNQPEFTERDRTATEAFENYSELDGLGRCGPASANVCRELMPTEERGDISAIHPTGWVQHMYSFVDGQAVYNRCHIIGFQLTGENANEKNLITGTRYMNTQGMLPFENLVADYVRETGNHVLYRVTPVYDGSDLVAQGVQMEGWSVEDEGDGVCFNVFAYNVQPGVEIDYTTGENWASGDAAA